MLIKINYLLERVKMIQDERLKRCNNWKEFACGWGAAVINITLTYPLNKAIIRQMIHGIPAHKAFMQLYKEGIFFLYRGILPPLCQKTLAMSIMFGMYDKCHKQLKGHTNPYVAKSLSGIVAGTMEAVLMPFERIQTLLSVTQYHKKFNNMTHAMKELRVYGIREYYRGLAPILIRNGPSNAGFFILRDEAAKRMPKHESKLQETLYLFITGATIGVTLSTIFYPVNVVKFRMQEKLGGSFHNVFRVFKKVYRERGSKIRHIYRGASTNFTRAFFSWGIINAAYENLKEIFYCPNFEGF